MASALRRVRIVGGPGLHQVRVLDAESGEEIHVRSVEVKAEWERHELLANITLPAELDVEVGAETK